MSRTAHIKLTVDLDADEVPVRIQWEATEAREPGPKPCDSMMLSLYDGETKTTAAIDLWTRDTSVADLNLYFYQVFHKMADTYRRATKNAEMANQIHEFGNGFGASLGLGPANTMSADPVAPETAPIKAREEKFGDSK